MILLFLPLGSRWNAKCLSRNMVGVKRWLNHIYTARSIVIATSHHVRQLSRSPGSWWNVKCLSRTMHVYTTLELVGVRRWLTPIYTASSIVIAPSSVYQPKLITWSLQLVPTCVILTAVGRSLIFRSCFLGQSLTTSAPQSGSPFGTLDLRNLSIASF